MDCLLSALNKLSADHEKLIPMRKFSATLGVPMSRMRRWCNFGIQKSAKRTAADFLNGQIKRKRGRPTGNMVVLLEHERFGNEYRTTVHWMYTFLKAKDG